MVWQTTRPTLLQRLKCSDDHEAWRRFDERYGELIVRYARRRGLSLPDAEDVRQIVLVSLVQAFRSFRYQPERGRFRSYLGRVVGNAIQRYRDRPFRRHETLNVSESVLETLLQESPPDMRWEQEWMDHHLRIALRTVDQTFDARSVETFRALLAGRSTAEVAGSTGLSVAAVQKIRQRVSARLKQLVAEQIREEEDGS